MKCNGMEWIRMKGGRIRLVGKKDNRKSTQNGGLLVGLEIHQQLDTANKLFCNCAISPRDNKPRGKIVRKQRVVMGETGQIDHAAIYEYLRDRTFHYHIYDNDCLVEMDCEPPHPLNREALHIALAIALMMNCEVPDEIHVMRKTVIDGSNTSAFQRTALIGMNGYIDTSQGKVKIKDVMLEEESAGIHSRAERSVEYDLNRLGIPLVEISTDASIKSPEHAKEVALKIGMILRSTRKVRRGLGTIRQDVNISIKGGARIEIKGFQDVKRIDKLIEYEVERQKSLIEIMALLKKRIVRKAGKKKKPETSILDVTSLFEDTDNRIIKAILGENGRVMAAKIEGLSGLMKSKISGERTLGKELASYAKGYGAKGIMHSDEEIKKYGLEKEFKAVSEKLGKKEADLIILVAEKEERANNILGAVVERVKRLSCGVPEETRVANLDNTTEYSRPLPGASRLYPETDIPPIQVTKEHLLRLKEELPETLDVLKKRLSKKLGRELANQIINSPYLEKFEKYINSGVEERTVANLFVNIIGDLEAREKIKIRVRDTEFDRIFELLKKKVIDKSALPFIVKELSLSEDSVDEIISRKNLNRASDSEIRALIKKHLARGEYKEIEKNKDRILGALMKELKGRASGKRVRKLLDSRFPY